MYLLRYRPYKDKFPKGAVKEKEEITLSCSVAKEKIINKILLKLRNDERTFYLEKELYIVGEDSFNIYYETKFSIENSGLYFYYFTLCYCDEAVDVGQYKYKTVRDNFEEWQLTIYKEEYKTPNWCKAGIMYQIFPDRFNRNFDVDILPAKNEAERIRREDWRAQPQSNYDTVNYSAKDFFMGNLRGIDDKLDYIKNLNVDTIYLNPIFESGENHRYSTADYFRVDNYLGSLDDFKSLVANFKRENIKLILDGVFSHTGSDSIYFNKNSNYDSIGAYNSRESIYYNWYSFNDYPDKYESWWGFSNLPTVNKNNTAFSEFINGSGGVLEFWDNLGIAGWRLDVADEFPAKFLEDLRTSVKSRNQENLVIGEVWENASNKISYGERRRYLLGSQLDTVMNYPWRNAILHFIKTLDAEDFCYELENLLETYPRQSVDCLMNMLSTHDTARAILELAIDVNAVKFEERRDFLLSDEDYLKARKKFQIASFIQFCLPGIACIYYGDEVGMYGFQDPFNRRCFTWDKIDRELLNFMQDLTKFRKENRSEFLKDFKIIYAKKEAIIYEIGSLVVVVNLASNPIYIDNVVQPSIDEENKIFGEGRAVSTDLGTIVDKNSYLVFKKER